MVSREDEMIGRAMQDRDIDDIGSTEDFRMASRIFAALLHPDCPVTVLDFEAKKLARHIAIRLNRIRPKGIVVSKNS